MKKLPTILLCLLFSALGSGQTLIPTAADGDRPKIDVESYSIDATVDPNRGELLATAEIRFVQLDRQDYVVFDLDRRLRVRDVYLGEIAPLPVRFRQFDIDSTLEVDLSELGQFDQPVVRVEYEGVLDEEAGRTAPVLAHIGPDSAFLLEEGKWFPMNGVQNDPATMQLTLAVPEGWRAVSALAERSPDLLRQGVVDPLGTAVGPPDAAPDVLRIDVIDPGPSAPSDPEESAPEVPRPVLIDPAAANPNLVSPNPGLDEGLGIEQARVGLAGDVPSFWGTLALGPYELVSASNSDGVDVEVLVFADSLEAAGLMGETIGELYGFYTDTFGEPISSRLNVVEVDGANWESRSVPGMLLLPSMEFRVDFDPWALAEHVAGQWFPLKYEVEDYVADAWLGDGLAVLASLLYFEETLSPVDALEYVERTMVKALSYEGDVTVGNAGSLPRDSAEYRSLAAYKGGFVLRMLRDVVGEEAFRSVLTGLNTTFADRPLSTSALLEITSAAAGEDLTFFFDQWLNSSGVPAFDREYTVFRLREGYKVMGLIKQDLDLFRMPVEIEVETDGESEYHQIWVSGPDSDMDLLTERKPVNVVIDPNMKVLRLSAGIRVAVHISRGEDLSNAGRLNEAIDEYQAAIDEDRLSSLAFFRMGEALFELGNLQAAANVFREAISGDLDPTWVEVWAYINLGKIFDLRGQRERAVTEYQKAVNTRDDAYGAQAEAETYLAEPFRRAGRTIGD